MVVRAPFLYPQFKINQFVASKESWILKHIEKTKKRFRKNPNELYLFGKKYCLKIINSKDEKLTVNNDEIIIEAKNRKRAVDCLKDYLQAKTKNRIENLLAEYAGYLKYRVSGRIVYKFYKSKWGSCSANNKLSFNAALAMAPREIIEYIFIHEIAHLEVKNHSRRFWQEVEKMDPSYKIHRRWLSQNRDMLKI